MIIEREGKKFWGPDSAAVMDENGNWTVSASDLVPWQIYEMKKRAQDLQDAIDSYHERMGDVDLLEWAKANNAEYRHYQQMSQELENLRQKLSDMEFE